jgi:hypothetical protein
MGHLNGQIEQFRYGQVAPGASEISALYQAGRGTHLNYRYDTMGRPVTTTISTGTNNFVTGYEYIPGSKGSTTTQVASITNKGETISYTYDANWNIKTITIEREDPLVDLITHYHYDALNQLAREDNAVLNKTIVYTYDQGGNILFKEQYPLTAPEIVPDPQTLACKFTYLYDDVWTDKLVAYIIEEDGGSVTYDVTYSEDGDIGNPLSDGIYSYEWTQGRRLASVWDGQVPVASYKYNDAGIRTQKTVNVVTIDASYAYNSWGKLIFLSPYVCSRFS